MSKTEVIKDLVNTSSKLIQENQVINNLFWQNFALVFWGGVLGGIVAVLLWTTAKIYKNKEFEIGLTLFSGLLFANAIIGFAGALALNAFLFLFYANYNENPFVLLGISIIAGFSARAMLPKIAKTLEDKMIYKIEKNEKSLKSLKKFINKQKDEITKMQKEFDLKMKFERNIDIAFEVLSERKIVSNDVDLAFQGLKWNIKENPIDRLSMILIGRIYDEKYNDTKNAIKETSDFIKKNSANSNLTKKDLAAAHYNLACYCSYYIQKDKEEDSKYSEETTKEYLENCIKSLKESLELDVTIIKDINDDVTEGGDLVYIYNQGLLSDFDITPNI